MPVTWKIRMTLAYLSFNDVSTTVCWNVYFVKMKTIDFGILCTLQTSYQKTCMFCKCMLVFLRHKSYMCHSGLENSMSSILISYLFCLPDLVECKPRKPNYMSSTRQWPPYFSCCIFHTAEGRSVQRSSSQRPLPLQAPLPVWAALSIQPPSSPASAWMNAGETNHLALTPIIM